MYVDRISWGDDGWPTPRTPGGRNKHPVGGVSPPLSHRWRPELSDEFNATTLEGVDGGVMGVRDRPAHCSAVTIAVVTHTQTTAPELDRHTDSRTKLSQC